MSYPNWFVPVEVEVGWVYLCASAAVVTAGAYSVRCVLRRQMGTAAATVGAAYAAGGVREWELKRGKGWILGANGDWFRLRSGRLA
eukprot:gene15625-34733_t